jgi:hypothetical protein
MYKISQKHWITLLKVSGAMEHGTHKPWVGSPNLALGTKNKGGSLYVYGGLEKKEITISALKTQDQGLITFSQMYLPDHRFLKE